MQMQTRLLDEPNLTLETAVSTALAMESAKRDASELCLTEGAVPAREREKLDDSHHSTPKSVQRSAVSSSDEETVYNMWNLVARPSVPEPKPFTVQLEVQGRPFRMELDTGASVSIIGESTLHRQFPSLPRQPSKVQLRSYCGDLKPVAGRNWIEALNIPVFNVTDVSALSDVEQLIDQHSILFSDGLGTFQGVSVKLSVQEGANPRFFKARTVPFTLVDKVSEELLRLQREDILEAVASSEWAAPILPVLKDGSLRICGDYKVTVNPVAVVDKYPIPKAEELWARLSGGVKFTKLDLKDAYQQLVLEPTSRKLTTINTPKGLFQYKRPPFGVSAAPSIFQREMETLLQGLHHVVVYFDDILVTGTDDKDHLNNLGKVSQRMEERGLKLKYNKCKFMMDSVEYLGHIIDADGLHTAPHKVEAVIKAPVPSNVKELQSFLGLVNYYRRFMPNLSAVLHPLHQLLSAGTSWCWKKEQEDAVAEAKRLLPSAPVLAHYVPKQELVLTCDASSFGLGAVLSQRDAQGMERPIGFGSRSLQPAKKNYCQLDREALAFIFAVTKFRQYLWGRRFEAVTDHKPLLRLFGHDKAIPGRSSPRIIRSALMLSAYDYTLVYQPEQTICHAAGLSRLPLETKNFPVEAPADVFMLEGKYPRVLSSTAIAQASSKDPVLSRIRDNLLYGGQLPHEPEWRHYKSHENELSLQDGSIFGGMRVVIPPSLRREVLELLHEGHPGIEKMKALVRSHVWWPGVDDMTSQTK
ncbi:uncharacterized protein K02A2.6-like [Dermacentor silvarum]|uniref:uncharacterized protein K02A2.6-like n=1 Tax=Dermacentor silvarum TaxID=543639 RepID=UPI0021018C31|nr:uncharacterized protein K02A2.6-like [Dermacentor silvarum]